MTDVRTATPYTLVSAVAQPVDASKRELRRISRQIEDEALRSRPPAVAAALQDARYVTPPTRAVYARLAEQGTPARLFARGLQSWLAPGVAGVTLDDDDPLVDEWVIVLPGPAPVAFAATDLGVADCADDDRSFRYAITRDPDVVAGCARLLGL